MFWSASASSAASGTRCSPDLSTRPEKRPSRKAKARFSVSRSGKVMVIIFGKPLPSSGGGALGLAVDEATVHAALDPAQNLGDAPDGERVCESGVDDVGPEAVERLGVVVLLEVARLFEELLVVHLRRVSPAAQLHHRAPDHVRVLRDEQGRAVARKLGSARPGEQGRAHRARKNLRDEAGDGRGPAR